MTPANAASSDKLPRSALAHMDMMRGVAALAVLVGHVRGTFFVDLAELERPSVALKVLYLLTGFGHQSVVVFFVLSGFFIGTSVLGSRRRGTWSWEAYLVRRLSRLYVVLIPALVLTMCLDLGGMRVFGVDNIYGAKLNAPLITLFDARDTTSFGCLLGNLGFLQYVLVPPYGTNSPLWSLGYEFWSYVSFPLLVVAAARSSPTPTRAASSLLLALIVFCGTMKFVTYFGMWMCGVVVSVLWRRVAEARVVGMGMIALGLTVFAVVLVCARVSHAHGVAWDYASAGSAAMVLLLLLSGDRDIHRTASRLAYGRIASVLAGFSYTTYLIHFPIIAFLNAWLVRVERWQPHWEALLVAGLICMSLVVIAYSLAWLTERHTDTVRVWVQTLLSRRHERPRPRAT